MGQDNCKPQPGDLIEIYRSVYQHWALYVGDGYVIHVTDEGAPSSSGSISSVSTKRGKVKKETLPKVVKQNKWRVNNKYDQNCTPRPVKEIIRRAEEWIGKEVEYNVLDNNCEHFVTKLRYGVALCQQVDNAIIGGAAGLIGGVLVGAGALVGVALARR